MGSVSYGGDTNGAELSIGGIIGYLESASDNEASLKNCANYGSLSHSGVSYEVYFGGIVGYSYGLSTYKTNIQNCLNYGSITHSGTTSNFLYIGGITGYGSSSNIENCVSIGAITRSSSSSVKTLYIGSILGFSSGLTMVHSYWTSDTGYSKAYGSGSATLSDTKQTSIGDSLVNNLNTYSTAKSWNGWSLYLLQLHHLM